MNLTANDEVMNTQLSKFGVDYKAPCYVSVTDLSGFFASNKNIRPGYAAYTDNGELLLFVDGFTGSGQIVLTQDGVTSFSSKKMPILPQHTVMIEGMAEGGKYKYKILVPHKIAGKFPSQSENSAELLGFLEGWK